MAASETERIRCLPANRHGEDYVVGDIHGHFFLLERLLEYLGFDSDRDRLLSVGDLIDRGPDSRRAPEFLAKPWFHAVRGNHEQMMLDAVGGAQPDPGARLLWYQNGGGWFDELIRTEARTLLAALRGLPHLLIVDLPGGEQISLAHADLPGVDWPRSLQAIADAEDCDPALRHTVWSRRRAGVVMHRLNNRWTRKRVAVKGIKRLFFGHTPMPAAIACGNTRWIDTGVFLPDGRLSIASVGSDSLWSLSVDDGVCAQPDWRVLSVR